MPRTRRDTSEFHPLDDTSSEESSFNDPIPGRTVPRGVPTSIVEHRDRVEELKKPGQPKQRGRPVLDRNQEGCVREPKKKQQSSAAPPPKKQSHKQQDEVSKRSNEQHHHQDKKRKLVDDRSHQLQVPCPTLNTANMSGHASPDNPYVILSDDDDDEEHHAFKHQLHKQLNETNGNMADFETERFNVLVKNSDADDGYTKLFPPAAALRDRSKTFQDVRDQTVTIDYASAATVCRYFRFVYENKAPLDEDDNTLSIRKKWQLMVELYVLAYRLGDGALANHIIDDVARMLDQGTMPIKSIEDIYQHTKPDSGLRRLVIEYCATAMSPNRSEKLRDRFAGDSTFLFDVMQAAKTRLESCGLQKKRVSVNSDSYHDF